MLAYINNHSTYIETFYNFSHSHSESEVSNSFICFRRKVFNMFHHVAQQQTLVDLDSKTHNEDVKNNTKYTNNSFEKRNFIWKHYGGK